MIAVNTNMHRSKLNSKEEGDVALYKLLIILSTVLVGFL